MNRKISGRGERQATQSSNHRYYQIGGITLQVESDRPITDTTFHPKFRAFEVGGPGEDIITIRHHFKLPSLESRYLGEELYRKPPWVIYQYEDKWFYLNIANNPDAPVPYNVAVFNKDHDQGDIYSNGYAVFRKGNHQSLTLLTTDQIPLGRALADRQAFYMHSSGVILRGRGLLFIGHSEAGKSTIVKMLRHCSEILCDDRIIVRRWPDFFRIHGSWSHGEIPIVSASAAPLLAIFFLKKSDRNCIIPVGDRREILGKLLACLIKPLCTADWWDKVLPEIGTLAREIACYDLEFDESGQIVDILGQLTENR